MPAAIAVIVIFALGLLFLDKNYLGCWHKLCDDAARQDLALGKDERTHKLTVDREERKALLPVTVDERRAAIKRADREPSRPPVTVKDEPKETPPRTSTRVVSSDGWVWSADNVRPDPEVGPPQYRRHRHIRRDREGHYRPFRQRYEIYARPSRGAHPSRPAYSGYGPARPW